MKGRETKNTMKQDGTVKGKEEWDERVRRKKAIYSVEAICHSDRLIAHISDSS
jgi:hypothetical protein